MAIVKSYRNIKLAMLYHLENIKTTATISSQGSRIRLAQVALRDKHTAYTREKILKVVNGIQLRSTYV